MRNLVHTAVMMMALCIILARPARANFETVQGFYPIWEGSADLAQPGQLSLSLNDAQIGVGDRFSFGLSPMPFISRAPNLYFKASLPSAGSLRLSAQTGLTVLLSGASEKFLSPMYASRLKNTDFSLPVATSNLSLGWSPNAHLDLTATTTLMAVLGSGPIRSQLTPGQSLVITLKANETHALVAHVGQVGLWNPEFLYYGFSYRYSPGSLFGQAGFFYRQFKDGSESAPLVNLGAQL